MPAEPCQWQLSDMSTCIQAPHRVSEKLGVQSKGTYNNLQTRQRLGWTAYPHVAQLELALGKGGVGQLEEPGQVYALLDCLLAVGRGVLLIVGVLACELRQNMSRLQCSAASAIIPPSTAVTSLNSGILNAIIVGIRSLEPASAEVHLPQKLLISPTLLPPVKLT